MDVHPPHEPIHSWRDFFTHLITITIGLFIALMLEAGVEWIHHKHVVREAKEKLSQEMESNRGEVRKDIASIEAAKGRMAKNIATLRILREHKKLEHAGLSYSLDWSGPSDSAWNTARDTGALSHMSYHDLQAYSDVYTQQRIVQEWAVRLFGDQLTAMAPVFITNSVENMTPDELEATLRSSAVLYTQLMGLGQVTKELDDAYTKALGAK